MFVRNPTGDAGAEQNAGPEGRPVDARRLEDAEMTPMTDQIKVGNVGETAPGIGFVAVDPPIAGHDGSR